MKEGQAIRNGNRVSKITKVVIIIFCAIVVIVTAFIGIYNFRNYKLYKYVVSSDSEEVNIYYNFKYMLIWNKTIEYIKENKKEVNFIGKDYTITIPSYDFSKFYNFNINIYDNISTNEKFDGLMTYIVDFTNFQDKYGIRKIKFSLPEKMTKDKIFDVYKLNNDEVILYKKSVNVENEIFEFNIDDTKCNKYIIVNVPLKDIIVENENIEIKNNSNLNFMIKAIPENATIDKFIFKSNNDKLSITSDGVINAKEAGEYKIEISDNKENIKKEITLKIVPVALEIRVDKNTINIGFGRKTKVNAEVYPKDAINKELIFESTNVSIATVDDIGNIVGTGSGECDILIRTKEEPVIKNSVKIIVTEKSEILVNNTVELTYINGVLIANKKYSLPSNYNPGVDATALSAYYEMKNAAMQMGFSLDIMSGFRSYETQKSLYNRYVNTYGKEEADTFSAEPGKSEHQTGLAFDLGWVDDDYAYTDEGKWLASNCYKYGFIIRYPKGKESITGYKYEPWHVRYLGNPLATDVYNSGLCLEEYLGI